LRLQFAGEIGKDLHLVNRDESRSFHKQAMACDCGECAVKTVETLIGSEFATRMMCSQVCLQEGEFGQGCVRVQARALPADVIAPAQARSEANFKLGHYPRGAPLDNDAPVR
jgi:hypothetical protein